MSRMPYMELVGWDAFPHQFQRPEHDLQKNNSESYDTNHQCDIGMTWGYITIPRLAHMTLVDHSHICWTNGNGNVT